jgi:hypothetical protein
MAGGGLFLRGVWLPVGTRVEILRDGYRGRSGVFKGKGKNGKLLVDVVGTTAIKLHLAADEIRRVQATENDTGVART